MILPLLLAAAAPQPAGPALDDGFDGPALAADWTFFHQAHGWPDKVKALDVGRTTAGALHLEPTHSAWVRDAQAPFLFKMVAGDFDVRARVRVRGAATELPGGSWSLGGLMARVPNGRAAADWQPREENWHFVTTGIAFERGRPVTETKGTYNSQSSLKLRPFRPGWVELRLVRVGMALVALARADASEPWLVRDRWYRMAAPPAMQVGFVAYTGSDAVPPGPDARMYDNKAVSPAPVDMALEVDWVRFSAPKVRGGGSWEAEVTGANPLADPNLPEAEVLRLLGE